MKPGKSKPAPSRLKVRIPLIFEAKGEGVAPVACVAVLSVICLGLLYFFGEPLVENDHRLTAKSKIRFPASPVPRLAPRPPPR